MTNPLTFLIQGALSSTWPQPQAPTCPSPLQKPENPSSYILAQPPIPRSSPIHSSYTCFLSSYGTLDSTFQESIHLPGTPCILNKPDVPPTLTNYPYHSHLRPRFLCMLISTLASLLQNCLLHSASQTNVPLSTSPPNHSRYPHHIFRRQRIRDV